MLLANVSHCWTNQNVIQCFWCSTTHAAESVAPLKPGVDRPTIAKSTEESGANRYGQRVGLRSITKLQKSYQSVNHCGRIETSPTMARPTMKYINHSKSAPIRPAEKSMKLPLKVTRLIAE